MFLYSVFGEDGHIPYNHMGIPKRVDGSGGLTRVEVSSRGLKYSYEGIGGCWRLQDSLAQDLLRHNMLLICSRRK